LYIIEVVEHHANIGQELITLASVRTLLGSTHVENATDTPYKLGSWEGTDYKDVMHEIT
jgi:hypothetical protein